MITEGVNRPSVVRRGKKPLHPIKTPPRPNPKAESSSCLHHPVKNPSPSPVLPARQQHVFNEHKATSDFSSNWESFFTFWCSHCTQRNLQKPNTFVVAGSVAQLESLLTDRAVCLNTQSVNVVATIAPTVAPVILAMGILLEGAAVVERVLDGEDNAEQDEVIQNRNRNLYCFIGIW